MAINIAINGYGRIGRNVLRALFEQNLHHDIRLVAINDLGDGRVHQHLTQYDTTHGPFQGTVALKDDYLVVNSMPIQLLSERDPAKLPWQSLGVDLVMECTGLFTDKTSAMKHIQAGAKKVIISAPGTEVDATVVYGVNDSILNQKMQVISNASCTTNCLAPMAKVLHLSIGIVRGQMTTVHAYTNDQKLTDVYHSDLYRARSATQSLVPTKTGAASAVGLVLPELAGKLDGMAVRVPTINVSLVDFTFIAQRPTSVEEVNGVMKEAAFNAKNQILAINELPLVSMDFNHNQASCIFDSTQTKVNENLVKVMAWYDNEWGFSNRMLNTAQAWMRAK